MSSLEIRQGLSIRPTAISPKAALTKRGSSVNRGEASPKRAILKKQQSSPSHQFDSQTSFGAKGGGGSRSPRRILSVDTGSLRGMIRQQQTVKNFIESAQERMQKRTTLVEPGESLPAINEIQDGRDQDLQLPYSPTRLIKESLRLHGVLNRDLDSLSTVSKEGGRNQGGGGAYEDFCESNYRRNLRQAAYYGDYNEASSRSNSYSKKMRLIKERTNRHGDMEDLDKLYSSDISVLKKLQLTEKNQERNKRRIQGTDQSKKEENFAGRDNKRKNLKKPTASEQRNIQKLFRRKQAREAAQSNEKQQETFSFAAKNIIQTAQKQIANASFHHQTSELYKNSDFTIDEVRVTDIRKEMQIRMHEFENRSSRFAKIKEIRQKLPFLKQESQTDSRTPRLGTSNNAEHIDSPFEGVSSPEQGSTVTSFASKGIQLRKVSREVLQTEQKRGQNNDPESPVIKINSGWQDQARMNVTHTDGHRQLLDIMPPSILDQQSNIKEEKDENVAKQIAVTVDSNKDLNAAGTRLNSQCVKNRKLDTNSEHSILDNSDESAKNDERSAILMEEHGKTEQSTINNCMTEFKANQTVDAKELTLSEHRKELIYDNFEPRPRVPRQYAQGVAMTRSTLPANLSKTRNQRHKHYSSAQRSPRRQSLIPAVYNKPLAARQQGPSPQTIRERNNLRKLTRSFDHANYASKQKMRHHFQHTRVYEQAQTITETEYDMEESEAMGATIDSSVQKQTLMPDSSQTARPMALLSYEKGQVSKSINLSTHAANIWHTKSNEGSHTQRLRSVSTKQHPKGVKNVIPAKMEAAWRYMVRQPQPVEKQQIDYGSLFTNQQVDSLSLPSVVHTNQTRRNGGYRTQLTSMTSPQLSPGQSAHFSRNNNAETIRKSQLLQDSRQIHFAESGKKTKKWTGTQKLAEDASIPIFMLGTNKEIQQIIDRVSQRSILEQKEKNLTPWKAEKAPQGNESQMYCPSVADLPGPQNDQANKSRLSAPRYRSPRRKRVSPPRVAVLNPPSPDLPEEKPKAASQPPKKKFKVSRPVPARPLRGDKSVEKLTNFKPDVKLSKHAVKPFNSGSQPWAKLPKAPSQTKPVPQATKKMSALNFDSSGKTLLLTKSQAVRDITRLTEVNETHTSVRDDLQSVTDMGQRLDVKVDDHSQQRQTFYQTQMTSMALNNSGAIKLAALNKGSGSALTATMNPENDATYKANLAILGNISESSKAQKLRDDDEGDYDEDGFDDDENGPKSSHMSGSPSSKSQKFDNESQDSDQEHVYQDDVFEKSDDGGKQD